MSKDKITLKEALKKGKLKEFIKERAGAAGDRQQFDAALESMVSAKKKQPKKK